MDPWKPDYEGEYALRTGRLKRLRAEPGSFDLLKVFYKDHPIEFITEWGMTFDPRNAEIGLETTVPFLLFPKQAEFLTWLRDRWLGREDGLAEKSRDMGVSWLCVAFAVWMWRLPFTRPAPWPTTAVGMLRREWMSLSLMPLPYMMSE